MFNIITDDLPLEYDGVKVRTDFKQGFKFFKILDSEELDDTEKTNIIMLCLFDGKPPLNKDLWEFINYYIAGGEVSGGSSGAKVFCFNQDAESVYSAFKQIYNIDLRNFSMHWWEFLALFKGLPEGTHLSKVIELRGQNPMDIKDPKQRAKLMQAQSQYMLKTKQTLSMKGFM